MFSIDKNIIDQSNYHSIILLYISSSSFAVQLVVTFTFTNKNLIIKVFSC